MYSCQPCPTCPDGKPVNNCPKSDKTFDINNKDTNEACYRPPSDNNIDRKKGLSGGAIAGIVISIIVVLVGLGVFFYYKTKDKNLKDTKYVLTTKNPMYNAEVIKRNREEQKRLKKQSAQKIKLNLERYLFKKNYKKSEFHKYWIDEQKRKKEKERLKQRMREIEATMKLLKT